MIIIIHHITVGDHSRYLQGNGAIGLIFRLLIPVREQVERAVGGFFAEADPVFHIADMLCAGFLHKADILLAFRMTRL